MPSTRIALAAVCFLAGLNLKAAITINSPVNGAVVASPVQLNATLSGTQPGSILVYDNNLLILQQGGALSISASLTLTAGSHTIMIQAVQRRRFTSSATTTIIVSSPSSSGSGSSGSGSSTVGTQIASDMIGTSEGLPHGVPLSYDWASGPVVEMGNNANGQQAMTGWGVVYEASQGNPATNTRVNIRNVQSYFL